MKAKKILFILASAVLAAGLLLNGCGAKQNEELFQQEQTNENTDSVKPEASDGADSLDENPEPATEATEVPGSTEPQEPQSSTEGTETAAPEESLPSTDSVDPNRQPPLASYEAYNRMTEEEQLAYLESFPSLDAFFEWYGQAKAEYDSEHPDIIIDGNTGIEIKP